ncbi:hypothetical protein M8J76_006216 [Diaphorina citri]|nr:hypothetical protein M8J76_006216 [Diaphorina citri]
MYAYQNTNICYANEYLQHKCHTLNVKYYHCNSFFQRRHYTRHGLHLNNSGKRMLSVKIKDFILSHLDSTTPVPVPSQTLPDMMVSTVTVSHPEQDIMAISCPLSASLDSTFGEVRPAYLPHATNQPETQFFPV